MNIISRIINLINGFFSSLVSGAEKKNPELVYESAINKMIVDHRELRKAIASITMLKNKTDSQLEDERARLLEAEACLETCLEDGDDALAIEFIERKEEIESRILYLERDLDKLTRENEDAINSLSQHRAKIDELKREKEFKIAQHKSAQVKNKALDLLNEISVDADMKAIENIRSEIDNEIAVADLNSEISRNSFDSKMSRVKEKSSKLRARQKLDQYKKSKEKNISVLKTTTKNI